MASYEELKSLPAAHVDEDNGMVRIRQPSIEGDLQAIFVHPNDIPSLLVGLRNAERQARLAPAWA